jgi:transposase
MEVLHRKCAGLEVHEDAVVGCARVMTGHKVNREVSRFATTARGLFALADWLAKHGVTHVGVAATGSGWPAVWHLLSGRFEVVLVDARRDDATWLADSLAQGLVQGNVAAPAAMPALRSMIETREQFGRDLVQHKQWILDLLEKCNLKLVAVTGDILGVQGRGLLDALIAGDEDPAMLAAMAQGLLRARRGALVDALPGRIQDHHRYLLGSHLRLIENIEQTMAALEVDIDRTLGGGDETMTA